MSFFSDWHAPSFFVFSGVGASAAALAAAFGAPLPVAGAQAGVLVVGAAFAAYLAGRSSSAATNRWGAAAKELGLDMDASTEEIIASLTTGGSEAEDTFEAFVALPVAIAVVDGDGDIKFSNAALERLLEAGGSSAESLFAAAETAKPGFHKEKGEFNLHSGERVFSVSSAPVGGEGLSVVIWEDATGHEDGKAALTHMQEVGLVALWSPDGMFKTGSGIENATIDPSKRLTDQCCLTDGKPVSWTGIRAGNAYNGFIEWGGSGTVLDASFVPVRGADGAVEHILLYAKDVTAEYESKRRAEEFMQCVDRTSATIEFEPDGTIVTANEAFLQTMGYSLDQIVGQHHRMFADAAYTSSAEYAQFWAELGRGETKHGMFKRLTATGQEVYILGAYASLTDRDGKVTRVIKYVTDVTEKEVTRLREQEELERTRKIQSELVSVLRGALASVADRDLDCPIHQPFPQGYEEICENFNNAVVALATALQEVKSASRQIDSNAGAIGGAANELASRTEAQAATLEQSAASLDELTASMRSASDRTTEIEGQVKEAKNNAETGGHVVKDAVTAMSEIEQSSAQIAQIIGVIDDIAFQTNLLALNAGVEAARAGDAGRGFAVVASEVRALAQRSSEAAKEIKTHIAQSTEHVSRGVDLVGRTGSALTGIVESFDEIERLITEVASSSRDQASGVSEINVAIGQLDRATQENAAMVEETTAAGSSLTADAQLLSDLVGRFKLAETGGARVLSVPRPMETPKKAPARQSQAVTVGNTALKLDDQDWEEF